MDTTTATDTTVGTALYTSAEGFVGKIVTLRNVDARETVITGRVVSATLTVTEGVVHVSQLSIERSTSYDLWTPFKDTKYTAKSWYWTVEEIQPVVE